MWILFALLSAIFAAARRPNQKRLANRLHYFTIGFLVQVMALPLLAIVLLLHGWLVNPLSLGPRFWLPLIGLSLIFYPLNSFLSTKAIKHNDLSDVLPIQSLWPVFSLVPAWILLGQVPTIIATTGLFLTVLGVYALGLKKRSFHHPLQPFRENQGSRYMLFAVALVTAAGIIDKIAIQASDAIYYTFASTLGAAIVMAAVLCAYKINEFKTMSLKKDILELALIGSLQGGSYMTYLLAISIGPIAYVTSIRSSNILIGSALGIILLKEKFTHAKLLSYSLIVVGMVMLALR
jgi:uncharacterized membrane protein